MHDMFFLWFNSWSNPKNKRNKWNMFPLFLHLSPMAMLWNCQRPSISHCHERKYIANLPSHWYISVHAFISYWKFIPLGPGRPRLDCWAGKLCTKCQTKKSPQKQHKMTKWRQKTKCHTKTQHQMTLRDKNACSIKLPPTFDMWSRKGVISKVIFVLSLEFSFSLTLRTKMHCQFGNNSDRLTKMFSLFWWIPFQGWNNEPCKHFSTKKKIHVCQI